MTATASTLAAQAEAILSQQFAQLREPTKYIASFRTKNGKHIALTRQTKNDIYIWAQCSPAGSMDGISVKNTKFPGLPYSVNQPRNSNLNTASNQLGIGNQAYYFKFETLGALERFARWYDSM